VGAAFCKNSALVVKEQDKFVGRAGVRLMFMVVDVQTGEEQSN